MAAPKSAQKVPKSAKPRGKPFQAGDDPRRGKAGGRPPNDQRITYWLEEFGQMTPEQLAGLFEKYSKQLRAVGGDLPIFAHIAVRALMDQINQPTPGLFALLLERTEGKVPQPNVTMSWGEYLKQKGYDPATVFEHLVRNAAELTGSNADRSLGSGPDDKD